MRGKFVFVVGLATGYVLGTRAGRERYEQIAAGAAKVWNTPTVQSGVQKVQEFAGGRVDTVKADVSKRARKALAGLIGREPLDGPQQSAAAAKVGKTTPRPAAKPRSATPKAGTTGPVKPMTPAEPVGHDAVEPAADGDKS
jgi:hypothetical protein